MLDAKIVENLSVLSLFILYRLLWMVKRRGLKHTLGIDPEVFKDASKPIQQYMHRVLNILTLAVVAIIVMKFLNIKLYSFLSPFPPFEKASFDLAGYIIGLAGLGICAIAQRTMGISWRVGIDEKQVTPLISTGIFAYSRNPTYLGLLMLLTGVWMIWPMWAIGIYNLLFFLFIDLQIRFEESHLLQIHGGKYSEYKTRTRRYFGIKF